jgi:hypothetical protein
MDKFDAVYRGRDANPSRAAAGVRRSGSPADEFDLLSEMREPALCPSGLTKRTFLQGLATVLNERSVVARRETLIATAWVFWCREVKHDGKLPEYLHGIRASRID